MGLCPLNVFQTYIKNFNRKLFHGKVQTAKNSLTFFFFISMYHNINDSMEVKH